MTFHENCLLAENIIPYFCRKLGKMSQNLSSAALVMDALRVKEVPHLGFSIEDLAILKEAKLFRNTSSFYLSR